MILSLIPEKVRYANLDNMDFEGGDFRNCDLTEVQIEETTPVLAVTADYSGNRISFQRTYYC